jgi:hypothetical protein
MRDSATLLAMSVINGPSRTFSGPGGGERLAYLAFAVAGFVGTQAALVAALRAGDGFSEVWDALTRSPTAVFVTIDLTVVFLAAMVFMVVEGRRLALRLWWLYPLLSVAIGVSTGFPLFLLARRIHERA